jgi:pimeloyl-ACP methyl ester carboxylesterase
MDTSVKLPDGASIGYSVDSALAAWEKPAQTLVMHHGVGFNRDAWKRWLPQLLGAGYKVIRLDMRGHGKSTRPASGYRWTTDQFLDDLNAVLDAERVERTHFVGESWGGTIGLAWAAKFPKRAQSLSVMSTTYDGSLVPMIDGFAEMIRKEGIEVWTRTMNEARFFPDADPNVLEWAAKAQNDCTPHVIGEIFAYILKQSIEKQLPTIEIPVQILAPQGSPFVKPSLAYELRNRLKDCEMDIFPGHRHGLVLSGAHIACESMMNFIKRRFGK